MVTSTMLSPYSTAVSVVPLDAPLVWIATMI